MTTIAALESGTRFVVRRVALAREVGKRLADMGFTDGSLGTVVRKSLFKGPLHVRIRDYDVVLRRSEADGIEVEPFFEKAAKDA